MTREEIELEAKKLHAEFPTNWTYHAPVHFERLYYFFQQLLSQISQLEEKVKELESERDSETRWAKEYFDKWEKAEERVRELEKRQEWIDEVGRPQHPDDERPWVPAYLDCREALGQAEASLTRLLEAVERHKNEDEWKSVYGNRDEALYQVAEGIRKEKP